MEKTRLVFRTRDLPSLGLRLDSSKRNGQGEPTRSGRRRSAAGVEPDERRRTPRKDRGEFLPAVKHVTRAESRLHRSRVEPSDSCSRKPVKTTAPHGLLGLR